MHLQCICDDPLPNVTHRGFPSNVRTLPPSRREPGSDGEPCGCTCKCSCDGGPGAGRSARCPPELDTGTAYP